MFDKQGGFSYITVLGKQGTGQTYSRIECEIMHRHGILEYIPGNNLRISKKQKSIAGKSGFSEALSNTYLKFHIGIVGRRFMDRICSYCEIIVTVKCEIRAVVEFLTERIGDTFIMIDYLSMTIPIISSDLHVKP